jgi:hypothetical protein
MFSATIKLILTHATYIMTAMREECKLCGRIMPYYSLKQCYKCGQLYCKNCILTGRDTVPLLQEGNIICLNCARKLVSPKTPNKFDLLRNYLKFRASFTNRIVLTFAKFEGIISDNLPFAAIRDENWWTNTSSVHARAWLNAGWKVESINLKDRNITFTKIPDFKVETAKKRRKRKEDTTAWALKLDQMAKPRTIKKPSMTKIAKVQARLKNIEQQQSSIRRFRGKLRQRPTHEKRLFKPEAKPGAQDK